MPSDDEAVRSLAGLWTVYRQDDPGNRFVVREHLSREEAERVAAEFQARGHKQVYWAEPETPAEEKD